MPSLIDSPSVIEAAGNKPKRIEEFVGRNNSDESRLSVARMVSPEGWREPGQTPRFLEVTYVLQGTLKVESRDGELMVGAGQVVQCEPGEWVRYSTPEAGGAKYIAICLPAFSPDTVHRDVE